MSDINQHHRDEAAKEIFDSFLKENPVEDSTLQDLIKKVIAYTLVTTEDNFKAVADIATTVSLQLPPDVEFGTGIYSSFTYTVADSPTHGRVVLLGGSTGTGVTEPVFMQHFETLKHVVNNNAPTPVTRH